MARSGSVELTLLADRLGFPEGPIAFGDDSLVFCDGNTGQLLRWRNGVISTHTITGGSPWGTALSADGSIYVTQGGNVPGSGDYSAVPSIQVVRPDGPLGTLATAVGDRELAAPNDLAFGPDGRLWFTDSGTERDPRVAGDDRVPGRLYALGRNGSGELIFERPGAHPNGIAFDARGQLYWTESYAHRVCRMDDRRPEVFCQFGGEDVPDGMAFAADGRLFVCIASSGCVTVVSPEGVVIEEIRVGALPTNCAFQGNHLYVTATGVLDVKAGETTGSLWRIRTDAAKGSLPLLFPNTLDA